jgi:hypothetical protein
MKKELKTAPLILSLDKYEKNMKKIVEKIKTAKNGVKSSRGKSSPIL